MDRLEKEQLFLCVARLFRFVALRTNDISCVAFVSSHGLKNDECCMCSALVSPHGLKNDVYFMCSVCLTSWLKERRMLHV